MIIDESIYITKDWALCANYISDMKIDVFFESNTGDEIEVSKEMAEEIIAFLEKHFKLGAKQ